jgi:hypothetical protein
LWRKHCPPLKPTAIPLQPVRLSKSTPHSLYSFSIQYYLVVRITPAAYLQPTRATHASGTCDIIKKSHSSSQFCTRPLYPQAIAHSWKMSTYTFDDLVTDCSARKWRIQMARYKKKQTLCDTWYAVAGWVAESVVKGRVSGKYPQAS